MGVERGVTIIEGQVGFGHSTFTLLLQNELKEKGVTSQIISPRTDADTMTRFLWNLAAKGYSLAAQSDILRHYYERARSKSEGNSLRTRTRRGIESQISPDSIVVSDHAYASISNEYLIQGDVKGGKSYASDPGERTQLFVPLEVSVNELVLFGHSPDLIHKVGFFVPPLLNNPQIRSEREERIGTERLHVSFLTSGAYPKDHINLLRKKVLPTLAERMKPQSRSLMMSIYAGTNRELAMELVTQSIGLGIPTVLNDDDTTDGTWGVRVCYSQSPHDAIRTSFRLAAQSDLVVTMANERTGWVGAGVPLALLNPIGLNARENTQYLLAHRLAISPHATERIDEGIETLIKTKGKALKLMQSRARDMEIPVQGARTSAQIIYQAVSDNGS